MYVKMYAYIFQLYIIFIISSISYCMILESISEIPEIILWNSENVFIKLYENVKGHCYLVILVLCK